ncbi:MAG: glycoside hydrolase family 32 protein [Chloroflexota bacterium]
MPLFEPYRPQYHFTPPANWMNDPNGLVYYKGEYHVFYQYNPDSTVWGPMHWGHAVSLDLVNWQHLPIALYPDDNGVIFSGSAVIDWHNTAGFGKEAMVIIFTHDKDEEQSQSLAYSTDRGRTWTKYSGNPVLSPPNNIRNFRDPKVFWYGDQGTGHWVMSVAAGSAILFLTSPNLIDWTSSGGFGFGYGETRGVWETPDLFELPVDGGPATRWVLTVGVQDGAPTGGSGTQYFIGTFDGKTFISENPKDTVLWVDFGADYYAAQSWSDEPAGRRLMLGWQNNWEYARVIPTSTWRGALSLPRQLSLTQTADGIRLLQQPISELQTLRNAHQHWQDETITPGSNLLAGVHGDALEIIAEFQENPSADCFGFRVHVGADEFTTIGFNPQQNKLFVDRSHSGRSDFYAGFAATQVADLIPVNGVLRLHIFVDRASVEVFGNDGQVVFSDSIFPSEQSQGLEIFAEGSPVMLNRLDIYQLNSARFLISNGTANSP